MSPASRQRLFHQLGRLRKPQPWLRRRNHRHPSSHPAASSTGGESTTTAPDTAAPSFQSPTYTAASVPQYPIPHLPSPQTRSAPQNAAHTVPPQPPTAETPAPPPLPSSAATRAIPDAVQALTPKNGTNTPCGGVIFVSIKSPPSRLPHRRHQPPRKVVLMNHAIPMQAANPVHKRIQPADYPAAGSPSPSDAPSASDKSSTAPRPPGARSGSDPVAERLRLQKMLQPLVADQPRCIGGCIPLHPAKLGKLPAQAHPRSPQPSGKHIYRPPHASSQQARQSRAAASPSPRATHQTTTNSSDSRILCIPKVEPCSIQLNL
jgi:hypothetical protein